MISSLKNLDYSHCSVIFLCKRCRWIITEGKRTSDIMTIQEVCDYLKLNDKTAYRFAAEGKIPGFKVGGSWRFRKSEIDACTKEQSNKGIKK